MPAESDVIQRRRSVTQHLSQKTDRQALLSTIVQQGNSLVRAGLFRYKIHRHQRTKVIGENQHSMDCRAAVPWLLLLSSRKVQPSRWDITQALYVNSIDP